MNYYKDNILAHFLRNYDGFLSFLKKYIFLFIIFKDESFKAWKVEKKI